MQIRCRQRLRGFIKIQTKSNTQHYDRKTNLKTHKVELSASWYWYHFDADQMRITPKRHHEYSNKFKHATLWQENQPKGTPSRRALRTVSHRHIGTMWTKRNTYHSDVASSQYIMLIQTTYRCDVASSQCVMLMQTMPKVRHQYNANRVQATSCYGMRTNYCILAEACYEYSITFRGTYVLWVTPHLGSGTTNTTAIWQCPYE